jgi:hypothetical protein
MVRFLAKKGLIFLNGQMKGSSEFDLEHEIIYKTRVKETRRGMKFFFVTILVNTNRQENIKTRYWHKSECSLSGFAEMQV